MPSKSPFIILFIFLHHIIPSTAVNTTTICNTTLYPSYCKSLLLQPSTTSTTTHIRDYRFFSVKHSVSQAKRFLKLLQKYLRKSRRLTPAAIRVLEDCQSLAEINLDFLTQSLQVLTGNSVISDEVADNVQTMVSAVITNQETCLDGLQSTASAWSLKKGLALPLSSDTKLYSISLALLTKGWVPKRKETVKNRSIRSGFRNGHLPPKLSKRTRRVFEIASRRKLADDDDEVLLVNDIVTVSQDGTGNFSTIMDAVNAAPNKTKDNDGYFVIYITAGVYNEYVYVDKTKRYIMMIGDGINQTVITGNRSMVDGFTTFQSATFAVAGKAFVAVNITIRNTAGAIKHQAVALRSSADLSSFYSCSFEGYQDTLYVHSLRQFYRDCNIYGTVDFIFGNAAVVFQNCNLIPRLPLPNQFNAITAQGRTDPNQNTGISILDCSVFPSDDLKSSNSTVQTYLGRPWKNYSRTVFMESYLDGFINPAGWREWSGTFALDTLYYGEFNNTGPGSDCMKRVGWSGVHVMNSTDAVNFTVSSFLVADDWLPRTGVPYFTGFLST